jgi:hypothetical protein
MNGSGVSNQSTDTGDSLQALGFHIGTIGDTAVVGQEAETVVYYASNNGTSLAAAQEVANAMSGAVIMAYDPSEVSPGSAVTVVTGTDFSVNAPPPSGSTSGTGASPTTPTTSPSGSAAFASPTPEVEALQPWDPRSCTAAGGEGT